MNKIRPLAFGAPPDPGVPEPGGFFMRTAILIDGGFFTYRFRALQGNQTPRQAARKLHWMCLKHLRCEKRSRRQLYRIFYYDCPPLTKRAHHPLTGKPIHFATSQSARWKLAFFDELKRLRKVALRLGVLGDGTLNWKLRPETLRDLLKHRVALADLQEDDIRPDIRQKGVDMRIGLDIASMAFKKQVDQIILISGDSDFVPAAKLARREGIDLILDPMWGNIGPDLREHIDGLRSVFQRTPCDGTDRERAN